MKKLEEIFESIKDKLSPRERDVIRLRYGLDDNRMRVLEEVAQLFGVTAKEIEKNINAAFEKAPKEMELIEKEVLIKNAYRNLANNICEYVPYSYDYKKLREYSDNALNELAEDEKEILSLRFGLDGSTFRDLAEVMEMLGLSEERATQLEGKALRKLRHPERCKELREYLEELEKK